MRNLPVEILMNPDQRRTDEKRDTQAIGIKVLKIDSCLRYTTPVKASSLSHNERISS